MSYRDGQLRESASGNEDLIDKAQAHARFARWAYQEQWHR